MALESLSALHQISSIFAGKDKIPWGGVGFTFSALVLVWISQNPLFPLKDQASGLIALIASFDAFSHQMFSYLIVFNNWVFLPLLVLEFLLERKPTRFRLLQAILKTFRVPYTSLLFLSSGLRTGVIICVGFYNSVGTGTVFDFLAIILTIFWMVMFGGATWYMNYRRQEESG